MNKDFYSGLYSGILATIICNPLDVIRTHKQLNKDYKLSINYLYRGIGINLISVTSFWSLYFPVYNKLKKNNYGVFSGYISSNIASTILCPLFFIRQKYQVDNKFNLIQFYNKNGIKPFYNSLIPTYIVNMSFLIQMPIYEFLKSSVDNDTFNISIISCLSKTVGTILTYPIDTIRTIKRTHFNTSIINIIQKLNKNKMKYYSGILTYLFRSLPSNIIIFCTYEYINKTL